ncbi:ATP-dependent nuclease [Zophobihabitans entericus]|uniref:AAA family ATPase n=1 Tax=Zophobihabitans entericus TaxID=1635327 RepID=A0A6G9I7Q9_9GAMM|nr:AAA family ATPase [Zophobihabitans entericus]QIQ20243.1 AAA family ATPase [Zophobihabitans entericus]
MKLAALLISNFKGISDEVTILMDNIVVLIGPNNCCKSTILDAYEAYVSMGSALSIEYFHNQDSSNTILITGVFVDITEEDQKTIGQEWVLANDPNFGTCAKFQVRWEAPNEKGQKYSFSKDTNDWKKGGAGGWDTLLQSRLPTPIRINPNDDYDSLEKIVKDLVSKKVSEKLKNDNSKLANIIEKIEDLAQEVKVELSGNISQVNEKIQSELNKVFSGISVSFDCGVGKLKTEDIIKDGSKFNIQSNGCSTSLSSQGSGVQRAFLWSAINALCSENLFIQSKKLISSDKPKILLIDEPEINLHPAVIKAARKAIYALAEVDGWQIICTTHSPIFIDLAQNHTTLIKVSNSPDKIYYFQTDKANFTDDEKDNLKMLNRCCPTVNEFFFYQKSILVEGDTEYLAYQYLIDKLSLNDSHCVINCRGKANIPSFIKIFNQFKATAIAIHDLDSEYDKSGRKNPMRTININIREAADQTEGRVQTVVHYPDFEGFYFNESISKDKPYNLMKHLNSDHFEESPKYELLRNALSSIIDNSHSGLYTDISELEKLDS